MLWLLHREGFINAGQMVLESLAKVARKKEALLQTLSKLQAWKRVIPDRIVSLLEAAKQASRDVETTERIERILPWAMGLRSMGEKQDVRNCSPVMESPTGHSADRIIERPSLVPEERTPVPQTATGFESSQLAVKTASQRPALRIPEVPEQALLVLLKSIENLFTQQEERQAELRKGYAAASEEFAGIRADLQAQQELNREYAAKVDRLEQALGDRSAEIVAIRDQLLHLEQQLAEARQEVESASHRAEDYIHEATLARDNAVRSFQASLWDRLRACLIEILDDDTDHGNLSPDQVFFRHRLQEIRETLRELGVPPY
jgi:hypothetical protein